MLERLREIRKLCSEIDGGVQRGASSGSRILYWANQGGATKTLIPPDSKGGGTRIERAQTYGK